MRGDDLIAEPLIETPVLGQLAPHADADLRHSLVPGIGVHPFHQPATNPLVLQCRVDGDAADVHMIRSGRQAQAGDRPAVKAG